MNFNNNIVRVNRVNRVKSEAHKLTSIVMYLTSFIWINIFNVIFVWVKLKSKSKHSFHETVWSTEICQKNLFNHFPIMAKPPSTICMKTTSYPSKRNWIQTERNGDWSLRQKSFCRKSYFWSKITCDISVSKVSNFYFLSQKLTMASLCLKSLTFTTKVKNYLWRFLT